MGAARICGRVFLWVLLPTLIAVVIHRRVYFVGETGYGFQTTADDVAEGLELSGRTALITGATGGLGFESAKVFASHGAHVYVGGRTIAKAIKAVAALQSGYTAAKLTPLACSLESLADVQACEKSLAGVGRIDMLILNAGIAWLSEPSTTADGFETTMGVNHLAHFHLTSLLLPRVLASDSPRVVVLSSSAHALSSAAPMADPSLGMKGLLNHQRSWLAGAPAYGDSKLANALFARELHNRYSEQGLLVFSVDPGEIMTGIVKPSAGWFPWVIATAGKVVEPLVLKNPAQGAATQVYCALRAPAAQSGHFFRNSNVEVLDSPLDKLMDDANATSRFWEISAELVQGALKRSSTDKDTQK